MGSVPGVGSESGMHIQPFVPGRNSTILPEANLNSLTWMPVDQRAFYRRRVVALATAVAMGLFAAPWLGVMWGVVVTAALAVLGLIHGHLYVASLGWARTDRVIAFKSGWLRRSLVIVPLAKIQAVELVESPFDRRHQMASLSVDTAGAGAHSVDIPYLSRSVADESRMTLAHEAAATVFRW